MLGWFERDVTTMKSQIGITTNHITETYMKESLIHRHQRLFALDLVLLGQQDLS